jgi:hypothetical protein
MVRLRNESRKPRTLAIRNARTAVAATLRQSAQADHTPRTAAVKNPILNGLLSRQAPGTRHLDSESAGFQSLAQGMSDGFVTVSPLVVRNSALGDRRMSAKS